MVHFDRPEHVWLLYVAATCCALMSALYLYRRLKLLPRRYTSLANEVFRLSCLSVATLGLVAVSLAPYVEREGSRPIFESLEVIALLDITDSMRAAIGAGDDTPRHAVMLEAADDILSRFEDDRRAIIAFTTALLHWTPLTYDYDRLVRPDIERLSSARVFAEYGFGTNFASAIRGCVFLHEQRQSRRVCILLTDGEPEGDLEQLTEDLIGALEEVAEARRERDVTFIMIGIGDPAYAQPIPVYNPEQPDAFAGYRVLETGERIMTRPDHRYLDQLARSLGGAFFAIEDERSLSRFIDEIVAQEREVVGEEHVQDRLDVSPAILLGVLGASLAFCWQSTWPRGGRGESGSPPRN